MKTAPAPHFRGVHARSGALPKVVPSIRALVLLEGETIERRCSESRAPKQRKPTSHANPKDLTKIKPAARALQAPKGGPVAEPTTETVDRIPRPMSSRIQGGNQML